MRIVRICSFICLVFLSTFSVAYAAPGDESQTQESVILSPAIVDREVNRGESISFRLKVTNQTQTEKTFYVDAVDFKPADDESGKPHFIDIPESSSSASNWFNFPEGSFTIKPGARIDVPVEVKIPSDANSGGYYASVIVSEQSPTERSKQGATVGLTREVGSLVLLKVSGAVIEKGHLLGVEPEKTTVWSGPLRIFTRFENSGNIHIKPTGLIEITDMSGNKEAAVQINSAFSNVLPGSSRKFQNEWEPEPYLGFIPKFGRFKVDAVVTYGIPIVSAKAPAFYVWIIPIKFLLTLLGVIIVFFVGMYVFLQSYKSRIIRSHKRY